MTMEIPHHLWALSIENRAQRSSISGCRKRKKWRLFEMLGWSQELRLPPTIRKSRSTLKHPWWINRRSLPRCLSVNKKKSWSQTKFRTKTTRLKKMPLLRILPSSSQSILNPVPTATAHPHRPIEVKKRRINQSNKLKLKTQKNRIRSKWMKKPPQ